MFDWAGYVGVVFSIPTCDEALHDNYCTLHCSSLHKAVADSSTCYAVHIVGYSQFFALETGIFIGRSCSTSLVQQRFLELSSRSIQDNELGTNPRFDRDLLHDISKDQICWLALASAKTNTVCCQKNRGTSCT